MKNNKRGIKGEINPELLEILEIWVQLPLTERIRLFLEGKVMGLRGAKLEEVFPEFFDESQEQSPPLVARKPIARKSPRKKLKDLWPNVWISRN